MIRKDFITVEGCFRDEPMMAEVPTKAEYDDFRRRANAVFERLDKEVHELEDKIVALETKKDAIKSTSKSTVKTDESSHIKILASDLKRCKRLIDETLYLRAESYGISIGEWYALNRRDALNMVKKAFDLAGWHADAFNFTVTGDSAPFNVTITAI